MEENQVIEEVIDDVEVEDLTDVESNAGGNTALMVVIGGLAVAGAVGLGMKAWNGGKKLVGKAKEKINDAKAKKESKAKAENDEDYFEEDEEE